MKLSRVFVVHDAPNAPALQASISTDADLTVNRRFRRGRAQHRLDEGSSSDRRTATKIRSASARNPNLASKSQEVPQSKTARQRDVSDKCRQEALVPEIGDQIEVMGTKVDQAPRIGVVTDVRGRMLTVRWATGDQTVFVPAPGTLTVLVGADVPRRTTSASAPASRSARGAIRGRPSTTTEEATPQGARPQDS